MPWPARQTQGVKAAIQQLCTTPGDAVSPQRFTFHDTALTTHTGFIVASSVGATVLQTLKKGNQGIFALEIYCPASSLFLSKAAEKLLKGHLQANLNKVNKLDWIKLESGPVWSWNHFDGTDRPSPPTSRDILVPLDLPGALNTI